jgi:hypothetical protein
LRVKSPRRPYCSCNTRGDLNQTSVGLLLKGDVPINRSSTSIQWFRPKNDLRQPVSRASRVRSALPDGRQPAIRECQPGPRASALVSSNASWLPQSIPYSTSICGFGQIIKWTFGATKSFESSEHLFFASRVLKAVADLASEYYPEQRNVF